MTIKEGPDILLVSDEGRPACDPFYPGREYLEAPLPDVRFELLPHISSLGVVLLGTHLRRQGLRPVVIDNLCRLPRNRERFQAVLRAGVPFVGISTSLLFDARTAGAIVSEIRRLNPKAVVILGGYAAEVYPSVAALGDVTVKGHAEKILPELLMALREGRSLGGIPNLILNHAGRLEHTAQSPELWPQAPLAPDWDLLEARPCGCFLVEASRGCSHRCLFCMYPGSGGQVWRDPASVVAEMSRDREEYGARFFRITDPNFTSCPERAERLCELVASARLDVEWSCYARVDDLARRPGLAGKMRAAGCVAAFLGVESGDDGVLAAMAKGYDSATALEGLRRAKEAGLIACANFVIGFPGETSETVERSLELIDRTEPDLVSFNAHYLRRDASVWAERFRLGLAGEGLRWRHASMDSEQAHAHVRRAMDIVAGMARVSIGSELDLVRYVGYGISVDQAMEYFRAVKEWHAKGGRCGSWASEILDRTREQLKRLQRRWRAPCSRTGAGGLRRFLAGLARRDGRIG